MLQQSGGSVEVDRDQIEILIENNQCYTTQEISDILKISKSIKLLVKMKNVSFILQKKLSGIFAKPIVEKWLGRSSASLASHGHLRSDRIAQVEYVE